MVVDSADTVSAKSLTTRTLLENLDGFSQILKGHSSEKKYLGVFTYPIALIKKYENWRLYIKLKFR